LLAVAAVCGELPDAFNCPPAAAAGVEICGVAAAKAEVESPPAAAKEPPEPAPDASGDPLRVAVAWLLALDPELEAVVAVPVGATVFVGVAGTGAVRVAIGSRSPRSSGTGVGVACVTPAARQSAAVIAVSTPISTEILSPTFIAPPYPNNTPPQRHGSTRYHRKAAAPAGGYVC
jgi:hypothetical protein